MKLLSALILSFGLSFSAFGEEGLSIERVMALSKVTGACGIMKLQFEFQTNTSMPGGDDFMIRFWTAEAARLGVTLEEYQLTCIESVDGYNALLAAFTGQ